MARADVSLPDGMTANSRSCGQSNHLVRTAAGVLYMFYISGSDADFYYLKSTNYGLTWGTPQLVKGSITGIGLAVWFDKWTPADTGTVIHLVYMESTGSDVFYRSLDTASDTLGTEQTVFAGASFTAGANTCLSVTKSEAGAILVAFDGDGGTETGFYKSNEYPVSTGFTAKTDLNEAASTDYYQLFPGNDADTADIYALFWDRSAGELTLKTYDDSGNSWSESAAIATGLTSIASTTVAPQFSGAVRNSDGHLCAVWWTNSDNVNADLMFVDITSSASIGTPVKIFDSTDDQGSCALTVDSTDDTLYVFYLGKTDGTETAYTAVNVYYRTSTDDGATWGAETLLTSVARALTYVTAPLETDSADFTALFYGVTATAQGFWHTSAFYAAVSKANYPSGLSAMG